jgi:2-keto-3-deoxy-L-rhamnonate aldolase RhmA
VRARRLISAPGISIGTTLMELSSPGVGRILEHAGCDFAIVDMEHSGIGFETARTMVGSLGGAGLAALVKPPSKLARDIALACDIGADGVVVPRVRTEADARDVLAAMRYPPDGHRGAAFRMAHDGYAPGDVKEKIARANRELVFIALIEDRTGLQNAETIAAVDGVDGLCVGHTDLAVDLGVPGDLANPIMDAARERVHDICRAAGKVHCRAIGSIEEGLDVTGDGGTLMLIYSGDIWILQDALGAVTDALRRAFSAAGDGAVHNPRERQPT